ncbi:MAG: alpha/beta fold hydrolase [Casimicrobiaceae bacterium]
MAAAAGVEIPGTLRALMAKVGPRWAADVSGNVRLMVDSFDPVLARAPKQGVEVTRDIAYGDHPRQQLDVYVPTGIGAAQCDVAIFVHGGAFVDGHRNRSAEIYANVLYYLARHGVIGVNIEYRLAPEFQYPSGIEDVALAVAWTQANVARFGGDPARIVLIGHSAGAAHAAGYAYGERAINRSAPRLAGLIVLSGRVRADNAPDNPNARKVEAYYGTDSKRFDERSPVTGVDADSVRTMIAFAEFENPLLDIHCLELAWRLARAQRRAPPVLRLEGHNHTSLIAHINTSEDRLGHAMLAFIAGGGPRGGS